MSAKSDNKNDVMIFVARQKEIFFVDRKLNFLYQHYADLLLTCFGKLRNTQRRPIKKLKLHLNYLESLFLNCYESFVN